MNVINISSIPSLSSFSQTGEITTDLIRELADVHRARIAEGGTGPTFFEKGDAASRYTPDAENSGTELDGVYGDPAISNGGASVSSALAKDVLSTLGEVWDKDVSDLVEKTRAQLQSELGRAFTTKDVFTDFGAEDSFKLSSEVSKMRLDAFKTTVAMASVSFTPDENGRKLFRDDDAGLDVDTKEGQSAAVHRELVGIVRRQVNGLENLQKIANEDDHFGSELAQKALEDIGDVDLEELKKSLYALHKERFESGELELTYRGHALTPPAR